MTSPLYLFTYRFTLNEKQRASMVVPVIEDPFIFDTDEAYLRERNKLNWNKRPVMFHEPEYYVWIEKLLLTCRTHCPDWPLIMVTGKRENAPLSQALLEQNVLLSVNGTAESDALATAHLSHGLIQPNFKRHPSDDMANELSITFYTKSDMRSQLKALMAALETSLCLIRKGNEI